MGERGARLGSSPPTHHIHPPNGPGATLHLQHNHQADRGCLHKKALSLADKPSERQTDRRERSLTRRPQPASVLLEAVGQAARDPGALQGWGVPDSRTGALVVARLALLEDVLQVQGENDSKEFQKVRRVVVLVDDGLAELGTCRDKWRSGSQIWPLQDHPVSRPATHTALTSS